MFLLLSRPATHSRGEFSVDFRSLNQAECEQRLKDHDKADTDNKWPKRERIVVQIRMHINP